jgi:hypothetical protein
LPFQVVAVEERPMSVHQSTYKTIVAAARRRWSALRAWLTTPAPLDLWL